MRIGLIYNEPKHTEPENHWLSRSRAEVEIERPDLIFNLCEGVLGKASLEMAIAGIYELYDVPYTGSQALALGIALNKGLSKAIFTAHNIPTPRFAIIDEEELIPDDLNLSYP